MTLAIATMTWARTSDEAKLLIRSMTRLAAHGWPIVAADRTGPAFAAGLGAISGIDVCAPAAPGLVAQVQASVARAAEQDVTHVLYTESDKDAFFGEPIAAPAARAQDAGDRSVVIAARTDTALATYPAIQQTTEGVFNRLCGDATGVPGDYLYGPFVFPRTLASTVAALKAELGWGWRPAIFVAAARAGYSIVHVPGDHACPPDQRGNDDAERAHRLRQLSQNVLGLI